MEFPVLGTSAPGVNFVVVDSTGLLFNVNPVYLSRNLPLVTKDSPAYVGNTSSLPIAYMLIQVDNSVTMEKVRTLLSRYTTQFGTNLSPQTFGEVGQARISLIDQVEKAVFIGIALIIIVAGCSLAVAVSGSLIERKRPFTLLRLSGTPTSVLYRVVLLESVLPLIAVVFFSGAIGSGLAAAFIKGLAPAGTDLVFPGQAYYLTVGAGFIIAVVVILLSMPLLGRITKPENAKFE
jgi:ABC-type antimicrobial peptide transport system permease subunit